MICVYQVYKDKICQNESLKSRVDEMREENKILVEHKQMLEEQLESSRKRIQTIFSLENELYMVKRELGVAQMEMESDKKKIEELQEVNLFCLFISFNTFIIRLKS